MSCAGCGREGARLRCSRCQFARYCDGSCQARHWSAHKPQCRLRMVLREVEAAHDTSTSGGSRCPPEPHIFPAQLRDFEYQGSADNVDENLLILLHGRGDRHQAFASFGRKLELPQTAVLAVGGPVRPPELEGGRLWFEIFDENWTELVAGDGKRAGSLRLTLSWLGELIRALCSSCGWLRGRIFVLGYGDGGTVALALAAGSCGTERLGGVISVSGPMLPSDLVASEGKLTLSCQKDCTPVLITFGTRASRQHQSEIEQSGRFMTDSHCNSQCKVVGVAKDTEMVKSAEEARILHEFFGRHLTRRMICTEKNGTLYEVVRN